MTISPTNCPHNYLLFVQSHRSSPPPERHLVTVCPDCGQFQVSGDRNGVGFGITFDLNTQELVKAAGRYVEYLTIANERRKQTSTLTETFEALRAAGGDAWDDIADVEEYLGRKDEDTP